MENYLDNKKKINTFETTVSSYIKDLGSRNWHNYVAWLVITKTPKQNSVQDLFTSKPHLVAFSNCVYDLQTGLARDIKPIDFIKFTTGYPFPTESYSMIREHIKSFFHDLHETKEEADFALDVLCASCYGAQPEEVFFTHLGETGRNGKSKKNTLINTALGYYAYCIDKNQLCKEEKDGGDKPNTQTFSLRGKRYISTSESGKKDKFNNTFLNQLTGGDKITCRTHRVMNISFPIVGLPRVLRSTPDRKIKKDLQK